MEKNPITTRKRDLCRRGPQQKLGLEMVRLVFSCVAFTLNSWKPTLINDFLETDEY